MKELTAFQRDCLIVINGLGDPSGREILDELGRYYESDIFGGRLYPSLDKLVEAGLIEKWSRDGRTNAYNVTDSGKRWLDERQSWKATLFAAD